MGKLDCVFPVILPRFPCFAPDKPSSFFGQYGDERVTEVGRYLDATLEDVLRSAAE
jgi:hypothetical protein